MALRKSDETAPHLPEELQEVLALYLDTIDLYGDDHLTSDFVLVVRSETVEGNEQLHTYTSPNISKITAAGMLHFAQNDMWDAGDNLLDDDL